MATRRVYVDSRFRHSGDEGDFRIILDTPIELSEGALGYIDSVCLSNTFPTLICGVNNRLYVRQRMAGVGGGLPKDTNLVLSPGQYTTATLAIEVAAKLNAAKVNAGITYTVTASADGTTMTVAMAGPLDISGTTGIEILTSQQVDAGGPADWGHTQFNHGLPAASAPDKYQDAGTILGLQSGSFSLLVNESRTTGFVSMIPYRTLFLHSHLGSPLSIGPRGENTIVRRIIVGHTLPGQVVLDNLSTEIDNIELPPMLSEMHFSVRDIYGRPVELSHSISFALVIKEFPRGK